MAGSIVQLSTLKNTANGIAGLDAAGRLMSPSRDTVSALDFGAVGDGVTNDTAAIQAAIDSGLHIDFVGKTYLAVGLTQSTNRQCLFSSQGTATFIKAGNGPILTATGDDLCLSWLNFRGESSSPAFTGDNLVLSGDRCVLACCGSRWAFGRALKATGGAVRIIGCGDIYQTADAAGYDIEIGVAGTATLYHEISGYRSSQSGGGILLTDTGSHTIVGGQFGKLTIAAGTKPAGVNGGKTIGARILGATSVSLSNAIFSANQFGAVAVTLESGTSGCLIDGSNMFETGSTVTNSGNANNFIAREVSTGSRSNRKFGADSSAAVMDIELGSGRFTFPQIGVGAYGGAVWLSGSGSPEGAVTAAVGSIYSRTDGGVGTTLYVKESGAGSTGWVAK